MKSTKSTKRKDLNHASNLIFFTVSSLTRIYGAKVVLKHSNKGHRCYHGNTDKLQAQSKPLGRDKG